MYSYSIFFVCTSEGLLPPSENSNAVISSSSNRNSSSSSFNRNNNYSSSNKRQCPAHPRVWWVIWKKLVCHYSLLKLHFTLEQATKTQRGK